MRENLERILQFMAAKRIRMHQITSKEILEGNLKAVMRLILALAAHYKPQSVRHHDVSYESIGEGATRVYSRVASSLFKVISFIIIHLGGLLFQRHFMLLIDFDEGSEGGKRE